MNFLQRFDQWPMAAKFRLLIFAPALSVLIFTGTAFILYETVTLRRTLTDSLESYASITSSNLAAGLLFDDREAAEQTLAGLGEDHNIEQASLYDRGGKLFAVYSRRGQASAPTLAFAQAMRRADTQFFGERIQTIMPVYKDQELVGVLVMDASVKRTQHLLLKTYLGLSGVVVLSIILCWWLVERVQSRISGPLLKLAEASRRLAGGKEPQVILANPVSDEIGEFVKTFNEMAAKVRVRESEINLAKEAMEKLNHTLEDQVQERTRQLALAMEEAQQARALEEKSKLEQEIVEATNRERRRIAQDLHDGLGQQLTGIALRLKLWHDRTHEDEAGLTQEIERMIVLINEATSQTRQLARGLDPVDFIQGGLEGALRGLTDWVQRTGGVECVVDLVRVGDSMDHRTGLAIYRLTQEALNNALKHAKATRMLVRLHAEARAWQLTVMDNGVGFAGSKFEALEGLGLKIMRYRAESLGGVFHIGPAEGGGTEIRVTIPRSA